MRKEFNTRLLGTISVLLVAASMSGCSSGGSLRSAYDDTTDFGQFTTYDFYEGAGPKAGEYESLFSTYMVDAITKEMESRGYVKSADPDLLVNFSAKFADKTKVTTSPSMSMGASYGGYYGYRGAAYSPWVGYGYGNDTHVSQYTEGTFNIDVVDARNKKLIWEAVSVGKITQEKLENMREGVREGVPKFFALYPFVAGDSTPHKTGK